MTIRELVDGIASEKPAEELFAALKAGGDAAVSGLSGSSFSLVTAAAVERRQGVHLFVMEDKDEAAYLCNDLYPLLDPAKVLFFPTAYKRGIQYMTEDPAAIIQRTAVISALNGFSDGYLAVCTYPDAIAEKVVSGDKLDKNSLTVRTGDSLSIKFLRELLDELGFVKVDFVGEPGHYSIRGGIVDVFSFAGSKPIRIDFFGDRVDSLRLFSVGSQLSTEKIGLAEIIPNLKSPSLAEKRVPLTDFIPGAALWINNPAHLANKLHDIHARLSAEVDEKEVGNSVITYDEFLAGIKKSSVVSRHGEIKERPGAVRIEFAASPQPAFNKNFALLADDIRTHAAKGYKTYILTDNKAQLERLDNIFHSNRDKDVAFDGISLVLHKGFVDHSLKACFYTDHQIFERFHRYKIHDELDRSESLTVAELNSLQVGDYVVHIDHGVGRFGGLVRTTENGKVHEAIKLVYSDNDVLLVNVHALHRISKYKDKDAEPPKIYKLGSGAWQRLKAATKKKVKDIARDLIALYAERKASRGYAFQHDTYLQNELEASFLYEDTPDQEQATKDVKADMETPVPMDRLICGDVGFGKTEIAIRAAFKAASDGKQTAVLVPTTILSLQHYRTFSERLKEFPVTVENLSRVKTAKQTKEILDALQQGKIDILIGTHKILGKEVRFKDLGLLIIDEEQKFGVSSKEKLRRLKSNVDTLTLTATPIPRTLQFSLMGSRDMSVITTPPPNRQSVTTEVCVWDERIIAEAVEAELARGGQVFFVHNRIETMPRIQSVIKKACPAARIAVGHGQMPPEQMEKTIMDFIYGEYDILLATTIIESGIDIPNVNTIIINDAQNFGLSDLHQLRGRVGRTNKKAFCYLLTPELRTLTAEARRRLKAIEDFSDLGAGFNIAMQDLDIRGAGNLLGGEQSGFIADIGFDTYQKILAEAVMELRHEQPVPQGEAEAAADRNRPFIADCHIDIGTEAHIPDDYVSNTSEKIKLYRELDNTKDEEALNVFEGKLVDRFGPVPRPLSELFNVIRLRRLCVELGFEKAIVKNGYFILHFIYDQQSPYYKSPLFSSILQYVSEHAGEFKLKQSNNKLSLIVININDTAAAAALLARMAAAVSKA